MNHSLSIVEQHLGIAEQYPVVVGGSGGATSLKRNAVVDILAQIVAGCSGIGERQTVGTALTDVYCLLGRPQHTVVNDGEIKARVAVLVWICLHCGVVPVESTTVFHLKGTCQVLGRTCGGIAACHAHRIVGLLEGLACTGGTTKNYLLAVIVL